MTTTIKRNIAKLLLDVDSSEGYIVTSRDDFGEVHTLELRDEDGVTYMCSFDGDDIPEYVELKVTSIPTATIEEVTDA